MPVDHRERAFEAAIEDCLLTRGGYAKAEPANFDRDRAIDPTAFIPFVKETQPQTWQALEKLHGTNTEAVMLDDLTKALDGQAGPLAVLRHGFKCFGKLIRVAYFAPAHAMNPDTQRLYAANRLTLTRQLHYSTRNENSIDLTLSLNGVPVATAELKNPMTGQNVEHAKRQYMTDRDPREKVFAFKKRTLVHFAVDPDLVYMTTKLDGTRRCFSRLTEGMEREPGTRTIPAVTRRPICGSRSGSGIRGSTSSPALFTSKSKRGASREKSTPRRR
jgi:type I restriction enzyme R subunit